MTDIEHPTNLSPWSALVAVTAGLGGGLLARGLGFGLVCFLISGILAIIARRVWVSARLPADANSCVNAALAFAKASRKLNDIRGGAIRDVQDASYVVSVYHGHGRPGPRSYYRVNRGTHVVEEEDPDRWWPRGLK